jgi:hypothetical protein
MIDFPFSTDEAGVEELLAAVREHEPQLAVAPDVEHDWSLPDVVAVADDLREYAETVVIVPKDCHPTDIPDRFRVGLTAGSFGSMAPWGVWEYRDVGPVHVLGGSPSEQLAVGQHVQVASLDSFTIGQRAQFGMWDDGAKDAPDEMDYYDRLIASLNNYVTEWCQSNLH